MHTHTHTHTHMHIHSHIHTYTSYKQIWRRRSLSTRRAKRKEEKRYVHMCTMLRDCLHSVTILIDILVSTVATLLSMAAPAHYGEVEEAGTGPGHQH